MSTKAKILIVDDDPSNLEILDHIIGGIDTGFEIMQTLRAKQALQIAKVEKPEVIITDWEMPEMDGIELITALQADPETADIPVIMCTGKMISSAHLKRALDVGAVDYIRKPIDPVELEARLSSMLKLHQSRQRIQQQVLELAEEKVRREEFLVHKLELRDRDISELALMLTHKREMAGRLMDKLRGLRSNTDQLGPRLRDIMVDLQVQLQDNGANEFRTNNIDTINAEFFDKLRERFPALSASEIELCGMVLLKQSSKDIAALRNIDPKSVRKSRQRLRKKLNITPDQDLYLYLKSI